MWHNKLEEQYTEKSHTHASGPILSLNLHNSAAECIDAPGLALSLVSWVGRHGVSNWCGVAIDPVVVIYIMAVSTWEQ